VRDGCLRWGTAAGQAAATPGKAITIVRASAQEESQVIDGFGRGNGSA
jgi:hypothetical protein